MVMMSFIDNGGAEPYNTSSASPGLYLFNFVSAYGGDAGYIFEALWGNSMSQPMMVVR